MSSRTSLRDLGELLNGSLSGASANYSEFARSPHGEASLALEQAVRSMVRDTADTGIDDRRGLGLVMQRIQRDQSVRRTSGAIQLLQTLAGWFQGARGVALAYSLVAVQSAVIVGMWLQSEEIEPEFAIVRAIPGTPGQHEPFIRASFVPDASERDLRLLMLQIGADIVAGPNQLGDYYLLVEPGKAPSAVASLQGSRLVEAAQLVDTLPSNP